MRVSQWLLPLLVSMLALATPHRIHGQTITAADPRTTTDVRLASVIAALRPRTTVRTYSDGVSTEGRFTGAQGDTLWLSSSNPVAGFSIRKVDSLWTHERSTTKGAIVGGAFGAGLGTAFFIALVNGLCESARGCSNDYPRATALGIAIGGSGGALIGAAAGTLIRHWQRRYP